MTAQTFYLDPYESDAPYRDAYGVTTAAGGQDTGAAVQLAEQLAWEHERGSRRLALQEVIA